MKPIKELLVWQYCAAVLLFIVIEIVMLMQAHKMIIEVNETYRREHRVDSSMTEYAIDNMESWIIGQMAITAVGFVFFVGATGMIYHSRKGDKK